MTDILIRGVSAEVLAAIDAKAKRLGLSRSVYLRRALERERAQNLGRVTPDQFEHLATLTADLENPTVMAEAWT